MTELGTSGVTAQEIEAAIQAQFEDEFKAKRVDDFIKKGTASPAIDRLDSAAYPLSVRVQVLTDYRATLILFPKFKQAVVTHVFHKSADPKYRRAVLEHDRRLAAYFEGIADYAKKRA